MGSKALLVLLMFLASVLVLSAEVAPKDVDENFDANDGVFHTNEVDEMKYGPYGRWHSDYDSLRSGAPLPRKYCHRGCCRWFYGRCIRCCFHPDERVDAEPFN